MFFFFSSRRRHTRFDCDWSSDVCSSDLVDSLWVRSAHAGRGALVGGATLGIGFGALAASVCPRECDISSGTAFVRGGLVGVVLGGAIGALVGLAVPSWHLRLP